MKKINCNVIKDLIPLYVDDVVSEETKELVDEHISSCESCRGEVESMGKTVVIPTQSDDVRIKRFKRKLNKKKIITVCLSSVFTLLIGIVIFCYIAFWGFPMSYDEALINAFLYEDVKVSTIDESGYSEFTFDECEISLMPNNENWLCYSAESELDENGYVIGEIVYLRSTPLYNMNYEYKTWIDPSLFEHPTVNKVTFVFKDKTVVYGMDEKGVYEQIENNKRYLAKGESFESTRTRLIME